MDASPVPALEHVLADGLLLLAINVLLWLASLRLGKTWPVDFIWSCWPPLQCARILSRRDDDDGGLLYLGARRAGVVALVCCWGARLTWNFVSRGGVGHEDWRYADMRRRTGPAHFWWASLFSVFLGQTAFLFAACLSLYGALRPPDDAGGDDGGLLDACAALVCGGAIALEAVADAQMDRHVAARRDGKTDARVIDRGLWRWSRHPNYLGEVRGACWRPCWWPVGSGGGGGVAAAQSSCDVRGSVGGCWWPLVSAPRGAGGSLAAAAAAVAAARSSCDVRGSVGSPPLPQPVCASTGVGAPAAHPSNTPEPLVPPKRLLIQSAPRAWRARARRGGGRCAGGGGSG